MKFEGLNNQTKLPKVVLSCAWNAFFRESYINCSFVSSLLTLCTISHFIVHSQRLVLVTTYISLSNIIIFPNVHNQSLL